MAQTYNTMNTLNSGTRVGTMILDHFIMTILIMILAAPGMVYDMIQTFDNLDAQPKLFLGNLYVNIFAFSLYFNKDIYLGRSPAKRILKLQIVDIKTNRPANPVQCLVRNLTLIIWPVELIVGLTNIERRVGDLIAGTKLTTYGHEQYQTKPKWILVVIAIVISMLVTYLTMFYPIELIMNYSGLAAD